MLRIVQKTSAGSVKVYYTSDAVAPDQSGPGLGHIDGLWRGRTAEMLGLSGLVDGREFTALVRNRHPETGERITQRDCADRRPGYDFTFCAPKGPAIIHGVGLDDGIRECHDTAVMLVMAEAELDAYTRVRQQGANTDRFTGNLVWAEFKHSTARPVDGVADTLIHTHNYVFNMTRDPETSQYKAVQFGLFKQSAAYYEAVYLNRFAGLLMERGYDIVWNGKYWDFAGMPEGLVVRFSRRTEEIKEAAAKRGIVDPQELAGLGAKTSSGKDTGIGGDELRRNWRARMSDAEFGVLASLRGKLKARVRTVTAREAVRRAIGRTFERSAVVPEKTLLTDALMFAKGQVTPEELREVVDKEVHQKNVIRLQHKGQPWVTTREARDDERRLVMLANNGIGEFKPFVSGKLDPVRRGLSPSQAPAFEQILRSRDFLTILDSKAGSGKTTLMQAIREELERSCLRSKVAAAVGMPSIIALAPTSKAAREVLPAHGFKDANTVAKFLHDTELLKKGMFAGIVLVDEAQQMGIRDAINVLERCHRIGARVFFIGDSGQHGSIARGNIFRVLTVHSKASAAKLEDIQRQRGVYREAVDALARGQTHRGFGLLDKMGAIQQSDNPAGEAARDYVQSVRLGIKTLLIAPSRAERAHVTQQVREQLKAGGKLRKERTLVQLTAVDSTVEDRTHGSFYKKGQVVRFHQNVAGFKAGSQWNVRGHDPFGNVVLNSGWTVKSLPVKRAKDFQVYNKGEINLAPGDLVRVTVNCRTFFALEDLFFKATGQNNRQPKHQLSNGSVHRVKRFARDGRILLDNGHALPKDFGHIDHGYCDTSYSSQGKTADRVVVCMTRTSGLARNQEQFYVSVSRGKITVAVHTDDKTELKDAVTRSSSKPTVMDLERAADEEPSDTTHDRPERPHDHDRGGTTDHRRKDQSHEPER